MSSIYTQFKYITLLSVMLSGFKKVGNNLWNFRCPLCGDSLKNTNKRRGYIYLKDTTYRFHCHNCGEDKKFSGLLYELDSELYNEYRKDIALELLETNKSEEKNKNDTQNVDKKFPTIALITKYCTKLSELNDEHPARQYMLNRKVPESEYKRLYYTDKFSELVLHSFGDKYENIKKPDSGILFLLHAYDNDVCQIVGYQLRSIDPNISKAQRFMTCAYDGYNIMFGLDKLDITKPHYVVEGPIDSLFIGNSIAVITSTLWKANLQNAIYINDCEPRNQSVSKQVKKCIDAGYKTVMLPEQYTGMDINDIAKTGVVDNSLLNLINENTYQGLPAKVFFAKWSK